jgi:N-acetyl-anhydromuramyl-L-alanine amidase AmpD
LPNDGTELDWQYIVIHHTAAEEANTAQVKAYHLSLGWRDIGYNFVVERDGKIVVGRPLTMKGAHCKSDYYKKVGIAICGIGNFDNHEPTTAQWEGMRIITRKVQLEYNIPLVNIVGHGFIPGEATSCPGKYFDMAKFRSSLAGYTAEQVEQDLQNFNLKYNSVIETELDFEGALIDLDNVLIAGTGILAKF